MTDHNDLSKNIMHWRNRQKTITSEIKPTIISPSSQTNNSRSESKSLGTPVFPHNLMESRILDRASETLRRQSGTHTITVLGVKQKILGFFYQAHQCWKVSEDTTSWPGMVWYKLKSQTAGRVVGVTNLTSLIVVCHQMGKERFVRSKSHSALWVYLLQEI